MCMSGEQMSLSAGRKQKRNHKHWHYTKWRLLFFFQPSSQRCSQGIMTFASGALLHFITAVSENAPSVKNCLPSQTKQLSQPILLFALKAQSTRKLSIANFRCFSDSLPINSVLIFPATYLSNLKLP
jgi:hypothetical protein